MSGVAVSNPKIDDLSIKLILKTIVPPLYTCPQ